MHNFYYKRKVEDYRIVFAITEKETYYQIIKYSMSTQQKDYYSMYLECEYAGLNLHNEFRQIKRHICNKFVKTNKKLKTLLIENNFL